MELWLFKMVGWMMFSLLIEFLVIAGFTSLWYGFLSKEKREDPWLQGWSNWFSPMFFGAIGVACILPILNHLYGAEHPDMVAIAIGAAIIGITCLLVPWAHLCTSANVIGSWPKALNPWLQRWVFRRTPIIVRAR